MIGKGAGGGTKRIDWLGFSIHCGQRFGGSCCNEENEAGFLGVGEVV